LLGENYYDAKLIMKGEDTPTAVNELSAVFSDPDRAILKGLSFDARDNEFIATVTLGIRDNSSLKEIMEEILKLKAIKSVERYNKD
jgi:(p)ppGpp synthase/HD superfamily hydrolase